MGTPSSNIPFNRPSLAGRELGYIGEAIELGHLSGNGAFTRRCEALLGEFLGAPRALLTTSCTHALEIAALLLEPEPGCEVVLPSFTFVTTANAFVVHGWKPVFVDICPDTLNMDASRVEDAVGSATRALIPVHYAGVGCEMDTIVDIAEQHDLAIVEDNAHGLFGRYRGSPLGTFGKLATQSFHETKNMNCGEGGALIINDPALIERAEIIRDKGTDRARMFRGEIDKYTWRDVGSSYLMSDILAAFLCAQLEARDQIQEARRRIWCAYEEGLRDWAVEMGARLPVIPPHCEQTYHMFFLILPDEKQRDRLIVHLKDRGVHSVFHYLPLHLSVMGRRFGGAPGDCPVTESVAGRLVRLPFYNSLSHEQVGRVIAAVGEFKG